MNYETATNDQLWSIAEHDNSCPSHLLRGAVIEMIQRKMWNSIIVYAGKKAYRNVNYTLKYGLKLTYEDLLQIGYIEIIRIIDTFKQGMRTFKTYVIMCLITKFKKMKRDAETDRRKANIGTKDVGRLDEKLQERIFHSSVNVERFVINKIMLEDGWINLREVERQAILLEQEGYEQYEISKLLGFNKTYANVLLKRAYAKLRKTMGA